MNSHKSQQESSGSAKFKSNAMKPPIAPKPNIQINKGPQLQYNSNRPTDANIQHKLNINPVSSDNTATQIYSYPTSVLIKDEDIYDNDYNVENSFAKLMPLPLPVPSGFPDSNQSASHKGLLPALTKAEIRPSYMNQSSEFLNSSRSGGRTMSASAKNALLIEKIRGNINYHDGRLQRTEKVQHERSSVPSKDSFKTSNISVTNSINFFNSSLPENMLEKSRSNYQPISLDNSLLLRNQEPTMTSYPNTSIADVDKSYCFGHICTCPLNEQCTNKPNGNRISKEKFEHNQSPVDKCKDKYSTEYLYINGKISSPIPDSSINEVDSLHVKSKIKLGTSATYISSSQSAPCSPATKPSLKKSDAVDVEDYDYYKRLSRGISRATDNINIVSKARSEIAQEIWEALESTAAANNTPFFLDTPVITFTLPDLSCYTDEFRSFLEKDLIEMATLVSLEAAGRLNWWAMIGASQRLWPLATTGDGNCLLHAASLGMWGFHDRLLTLRKALHDFLTRSQYRFHLWRRWRWQMAMQNRETDLVYSQDEWDAEWESVLRLASSAPRIGTHQQNSESTSNSAPDLTLNRNSFSAHTEGGPVYESLEEIHVLALAHVLKRPIIVVADITLKDMNGDPLAPIPFGGIYLPLQCPPIECKRSPLLLTYDAAHFSSLVAMEINDKDSKTSLPAVIPVSDCSHDLLPIQFLIDPGEDFSWGKDVFDPKVIQKLTLTSHDKKGILSEYLDLVQVPIPSNYLETASSYGNEGGESPDSVASDPFETDKKSSESSFDSDDSPPPASDGTATLPTKVRAPRQLQTVVKSFGSISRSMSKKIKKNLSKLSRTGSFRKKNNFNNGFKKGSRKVRVSTNQSFILAASIHVDQRQPYQVEMIDNYLSAAKERFFRDTVPVSSAAQKLSDSETKMDEFKQLDIVDGFTGTTTTATLPVAGSSDAIQCINSGCSLYGTSKTSYMCSSCFNRQKQQEEKQYERQLSAENAITNASIPLPPSDQDFHTTCSSSVVQTERDYDQSQATNVMCYTGAQYGAGKSKFYTNLDEHSVKNATLIPTTQSFSTIKDKTIFLSNSTFYKDIPSYNLNKDLQREQSRSDITRVKVSTDSLSMKSPPNINDNLSMNSLHQEMSSLKAPNMDSLAPVCIDKVKAQLGNHCSPNKAKSLLRSTLIGGPEDISSKSCLTKGCPYYGNASSDLLCSKCHNTKKNKADSYSLDQIKFVQI